MRIPTPAQIRRAIRAPWDPAVVVTVGVVALIAAMWMFRTAPTVARADGETLDTRAVDAPLAAVRAAWRAELDALHAPVKALATNDATYEFARRQNFPFVDEHYSATRLRVLAVSTVLITDATGRPVFWRRPNDPTNRGFEDAEAFLAQLPPLPLAASRHAPGAAVLDGIVTFRGTAMLITVAAIEPGSPSGAVRGFLLHGRDIDGAMAARVNAAGVPGVEALAGSDPRLPSQVLQRLGASLQPVVVADEHRLYGYLPLSDLQGHVLRVYAVQAPRPARVAPVLGGTAPAPTSWPVLAFAGVLLALLGIGGGGLAFAATRRAHVEARAQIERLARALAFDPRPVDTRPVSTAATSCIAAADGSAGPRLDAAADRDAQPVADDRPPVDRFFESHEATVAEALARIGEAPEDAGDADWLRDVQVELAAPTSFELDEQREPNVDCPAGVGVREDDAVRMLLDTGRLLVRYQPQLDTETGEIVAVEALAAWRDEAGTVREAGELSGSADAFTAATAYVIRRACTDRGEWAARVGRHLPIGVNVGLDELLGAGFVEGLLAALDESGTPPGAIELEIDESVLADGHEAHVDALEDASRRGFGVAIVGAFSARMPSATLLRAPVSKLKVHRARVAELPDDAHARDVVDAVLAFAEALGTTVCAEGVEAATQAEYLAEIGCPMVQGWHYSQSVESAQLLALLRRSGSDTVRLPLVGLEQLERHAHAAGVVH